MRVLVGAPEEARRVEGAPPLEVSFAAVGAERAQRHGCSRQLAAHEGRNCVTMRHMAQQRGRQAGGVAVAVDVDECLRGTCWLV